MPFMISALLALILLTSGLAPYPAVASAQESSSSTSQPSSLHYTFARGGVAHNRQMTLSLVINAEDPFHDFNTGSYRVGFTARMVEFVVQAPVVRAGDARVEVAFDTVSANINGVSTLHVIPDTYNPITKQNGVYVLYIFPDGHCDCSALPDLIYSISGAFAHTQPLGELFTYLHPSLPRSLSIPARPWLTPLSFPYGSHAPTLLQMTSELKHQKSGWAVVSSLSAKLAGKEAAAQWKAERGRAWPDALPSNQPVLATGSLNVNSTLQIVQSDGVYTHATKTSKGALCQQCNGYSMPIDGTEHLHMEYTQGGAELQKIDVVAHLTLTIGA